LQESLRRRSRLQMVHEPYLLCRTNCRRRRYLPSPLVFHKLIRTLEVSSHFTCPSCQCKSCFHCRTAVHPHLTCKENLNSLSNQQFAADEPSGRWLKAYTKPCFCGRWIQKMDGCDHVKCPPRPMGCGDEWCWMCGAKYEDIRKKGNTAHKGDCPHFA
jgi:hypothetical protein